jgi:hypothetical protein
MAHCIDCGARLARRSRMSLLPTPMPPEIGANLLLLICILKMAKNGDFQRQMNNENS